MTEDDNSCKFIKFTQYAFMCKISGYEPFKLIMRNYDFFPPIALKQENINRGKLSYFFFCLKITSVQRVKRQFPFPLWNFIWLYSVPLKNAFTQKTTFKF